MQLISLAKTQLFHANTQSLLLRNCFEPLIRQVNLGTRLYEFTRIILIL